MVLSPHDRDELIHNSARHTSKVMLRLLACQGFLQLVNFHPRYFFQKGEGRHLQRCRAGDPSSQRYRTDDGGIKGGDIACWRSNEQALCLVDLIKSLSFTLQVCWTAVVFKLLFFFFYSEVLDVDIKVFHARYDLQCSLVLKNNYLPTHFPSLSLTYSRQRHLRTIHFSAVHLLYLGLDNKINIWRKKNLHTCLH